MIWRISNLHKISAIIARCHQALCSKDQFTAADIGNDTHYAHYFYYSLFHSSLHSIIDCCCCFSALNAGKVKWSERWLLRNLHFKVERFSGQFLLLRLLVPSSISNNNTQPKETASKKGKNNIDWLSAILFSLFSAQSSGGSSSQDTHFFRWHKADTYLSVWQIFASSFSPLFLPPSNLDCRVRHYSNDVAVAAGQKCWQW